MSSKHGGDSIFDAFEAAMEMIGTQLKIRLEGPEASYRRRQLADTDAAGLRVSTCWVDDLQCWETAICDLRGAHPVERYGEAAAAAAGHENWVAFASNRKNVAVVKLGYKNVVEDELVQLVRGTEH